jgi:hypothetical protein
MCGKHKADEKAEDEMVGRREMATRTTRQKEQTQEEVTQWIGGEYEWETIGI